MNSIKGFTTDLLKLCESYISTHRVMRQDRGEYYTPTSQYNLFMTDAAKFVMLASMLGFHCCFWNSTIYTAGKPTGYLFQVEIKTPRTKNEDNKFYFIGSVSTGSFDFDFCLFMGLYYEMRNFLKDHCDSKGFIYLEY